MYRMSLLNICITEVALMLKDNYWSFGSYNFEENNPFRVLPSNINEDIIATVLKITPTGSLTVADLYPVLCSGRIKTFKLEDITINFEEFQGILLALSIQGFQLTALFLNEIDFKNSNHVTCVSSAARIATDLVHQAASAVECLLALSPNLEKIKIDIPFNLEVLQKVRALRYVELNFIPPYGLRDMIPQVDDVYIPNNTIITFSILKTPRYTLPINEVVFLLQNCSELRYFDNDVSKALEKLHYVEFFNGSLSKQYKLQKAVLGDMSREADSGVANLNAVHIASFTCPHLRELDVLVNNHQATANLRYFKSLESLLVQWEPVANAGDFRLSLQLVLKDIGMKLTKLQIFNFNKIDFSLIGLSCPNLEYLKIEYEKEIESEVCRAFENLEELHLESYIGPSKETVLQVVLYSKNLTQLTLENVRCLDDNLMKQILKANSLSRLKEACFVNCNLQETGMKLFAESCKILEFFKFSSYCLTFKDAAEVVHSVNPFIVMADIYSF